jgi:hypothetical protein
MVLKLTLAIAAVAILVALGVRGFLHHPGGRATTWQEDDSLVAVARRAKAEGREKVSISGLRIDYAGADIDLDDALRKYSVFIAEPIESKSFPENSRSIQTWHRFRILETLSTRSYWYCATCSTVSDVPAEMGKPNYDEFFLDTAGGVLNVEGVEITQPTDSLHFEAGKRYLMFVNLAPSQMGVLAGGPSGVFRVEKNDALDPLNKEDYRLPSEVKKRFGLKLSEFRSHINR